MRLSPGDEVYVCGLARLLTQIEDRMKVRYTAELVHKRSQLALRLSRSGETAIYDDDEEDEQPVESRRPVYA